MTDISDNALVMGSGDEAWAVAHARPRREKKIADFCRIHNIPFYLPQVKREHRYGNRKRIRTIPLFSGYVFLLLDPSGRTLLKGNANVANLLLVSDQESLLHQLNQIKRALECAGPVELLPEFETGMKVEVQSGPMKGVEGLVDRVKSNTRIILNVDFIKQSIALEVDAEWLVPV